MSIGTPVESKSTDTPLPRAAVRTFRSVIAPSPKWPRIDFREIWKYRELLFFLVWRDVKVRYKQTFLGVAWAVLQPAMMMIVFTVFFNRIAGIGTGDIPPALFNLTGLLPWFFFQQAVNASGGSVLGSEHLITKIYFPRLIIPVSAVMAAVFDSMVAMSLVFLMCAYEGVLPSANIVLLPLVYLVVGMLALGLGTFIAALNVLYRDFRYIVPFALQLGMFATPTIYMLEPEKKASRTLRWLTEINPMTSLVSAYRSCVLGGPADMQDLAIAATMALVFLVAGCLYFRKIEDRFADVI